MHRICPLSYSYLTSNQPPTQYTVVYLGTDDRGKHKLSRKKVLEARGVKPRGGGGGGGGRRMDSKPAPAKE